MDRADELKRRLAYHATNEIVEVSPELEQARNQAKGGCAKLLEILETAFPNVILKQTFNRIQGQAHALESDLNRSVQPLDETEKKEFSERRDSLNKELAFHIERYKVSKMERRREFLLIFAIQDAQEACKAVSAKLDAALVEAHKEANEQKSIRMALPTGISKSSTGIDDYSAFNQAALEYRALTERISLREHLRYLAAHPPADFWFWCDSDKEENGLVLHNLPTNSLRFLC